MLNSIVNRVSALAAAFVMATAAWGAPVTPEEALNRLGETDGPMKARSTGAGMRLVHTFRTADTTAASAYVFAGADGFAVAAADDLAPALLGYGDSFDPANIPANMQAWIDGYARQIEWLKANPLPMREAASEDHPAIEALVTSKWGQDYPYNLKCPRDSRGLSVTGCLATALAQIINYHKCPSGPGTGTHSYEWNGQTLSFDYGATTFDWAHIRDTYPYYGTTNEERQAVADLMLACGIGVNMNYSSSASGASDIYVCGLLTNHLGYDKSAGYLMRDYFSADDWDAIVYGELAAGRPVLYCGQSNAGGHAFVCDGYRSDGYYHINWGWDGMSDGFFLLSVLDPYNQGTGGSGDGSGFNFNQSITIGIRPSTGAEADRFIPLYARAGMVWNPTEEFFMFGTSNSGAYSYSEDDIEVETGIRLVSGSGETYYAGEGTTLSIEGISGGYLHGIEGIRPVYPADLPVGNYSAYPVVRNPGADTWQDIFTPYNDSKPVAVTKNDDGTITVEKPTPDYSFLTIIGGVTGWDIENIIYRLRRKTDENGERYYEGTVNLPGGMSEFKFGTSRMTWDYSYGAAADNATSTLFATDDFSGASGSDEIHIVPDGNNISLPQAWPGGKMTVTVSIVNQTARFSWESAGLSGIETIDAPDAASTYYNLQGQPVANPAGGIYIRLTDGKATKVRIR